MLSLQRVSFIKDETTILSNLDLDFKQGLVYFIVTEPEGGKSLLLKIAGGVQEPTKGEVRFLNQNVYDENLWAKLVKKIGSIFQEGALVSNLSIEENLLLPIKYLQGGDDREKVMFEIIEQFRSYSLSLSLLDKRPSNISFSQKKLINFIRLVITHPDIYIIDEPLFNLNFVDSEKVRIIMSSLKKTRRTMIIGSNHHGLIKDLADEVIIVSKGKVLTQVSLREFLDPPNVVIQNFVRKYVGV